MEACIAIRGERPRWKLLLVLLLLLVLGTVLLLLLLHDAQFLTAKPKEPFSGGHWLTVVFLQKVVSSLFVNMRETKSCRRCKRKNTRSNMAKEQRRCTATRCSSSAKCMMSRYDRYHR